MQRATLPFCTWPPSFNPLSPSFFHPLASLFFTHHVLGFPLFPLPFLWWKCFSLRYHDHVFIYEFAKSQLGIVCKSVATSVQWVKRVSKWNGGSRSGGCGMVVYDMVLLYLSSISSTVWTHTLSTYILHLWIRCQLMRGSGPLIRSDLV